MAGTADQQIRSLSWDSSRRARRGRAPWAMRAGRGLPVGLLSEIADIGKSVFSGDLTDIIDLAETGYSIHEAFQGPETPKAYDAALSRGSEYAAALADPDHPLFQKIAAQEEATIAHDFAEALQQMRIANQRATIRTGPRGGGAIFNPERRDEALAYAATRAVAENKRLARDQARGYLSSAVTANQAQLGAMGPLFTQEQQGRVDQISGVNALAELMRSYTEPQQPQSQAPTGFGVTQQMLTGAQPINLNAYVPPPSGLSFSNRAPAVSTYTTPVSFR